MHDTRLLLGWVNCTDGNPPDFRDPREQQGWNEFKSRVVEASGGRATAQELDHDAVRTYLGNQRESLRKCLRSLAELEDRPSYSRIGPPWSEWG